MNDANEKFECFGLLELFGHQRLAGKISEQTIGGCSFIRCDVPAVGNAPAYTRFFTNGAIYGMTPTSEAVARGLAETMRAVPVTAYDLPRIASAVAPCDDESAPIIGTVRTPAKQTGGSFDSMDDDQDVPFGYQHPVTERPSK